MTAVWVALIVALSTTFTVVWNTRQQRNAKKADWKREDAVAMKAEEAARLLLAAQERTIKRTDEVARVASAQATETREQLTNLAGDVKVVHTLVNSNVTREQRARLVTALGLVGTMELLIEANQKLGIEASPDILASLESARAEVGELQTSLKEREQQQELVNDQQREDATRRRE